MKNRKVEMKNIFHIDAYQVTVLDKVCNQRVLSEFNKINPYNFNKNDRRAYNLTIYKGQQNLLSVVLRKCVLVGWWTKYGDNYWQGNLSVFIRLC